MNTINPDASEENLAELKEGDFIGRLDSYIKERLRVVIREKNLPRGTQFPHKPIREDGTLVIAYVYGEDPTKLERILIKMSVPEDLLILLKE